MHASSGRRARGEPPGSRRGRGLVSLLVPGLLVVALLAYVGAKRGESVFAAISSVPPWVVAGAVSAHLLTLSLRTEAWRTVLRGTGESSLDQRAVHAANAGAFLAGTVQGQAAMPTRIALLRRYGGDRAPQVSQIALADAPIVMYEVCTTAVLAAIGSTAVGMIPMWAPWAMLAGALAVLLALRLLYGRLRHRRLASGLGVTAALQQRLAQGPLDDEGGTVGDPLTPDRDAAGQ